MVQAESCYDPFGATQPKNRQRSPPPASAQEKCEMAAPRTRRGHRTNCLFRTTASAAFLAWMMICAPALAQSARETVTVAYSIKSSWQTGFSGEITIRNDASWTIGDWSLSFRFLSDI